MKIEDLHILRLPSETCYILMIKTSGRANNYERELTAFLTDAVGDCGVGDDWVSWADSDDIYEEESENYLSVLQVPNEYGCYRPCCIGASGNLFDTVVIFFTILEDAKTAQERLNGGYREEDLLNLKKHFNFEVIESKIIKYIVNRYIEEV